MKERIRVILFVAVWFSLCILAGIGFGDIVFAIFRDRDAEKLEQLGIRPGDVIIVPIPEADQCGPRHHSPGLDI